MDYNEVAAESCNGEDDEEDYGEDASNKLGGISTSKFWVHIWCYLQEIQEKRESLN